MANPTMSAEERAQHLFFGTTYPDRIIQKTAEQIRQAEQAAYERAAQVPEARAETYQAAFHAPVRVEAREIAKAIRALAQEPEEVA